MLLPVYNEGIFLKYSLQNTIKYVDEIVIVDSSPTGPSTDNTKNIIDAFDVLYPKKIKYFSGTFRRDTGAWDESGSRNLALSKVSGDVLMPHCGDMIYTESDFEQITDIVRHYKDKRIIYCLFVEFWMNQNYVRLYGGHAMEAWFPVLAISDIPFIDMSLVEEYFDGPNLRIGSYVNDDFLFVPNVFRYHYGWVSGFDTQVRKHIRNVTMGAWGEAGEPILALGEAGIANWAIHHVLDYPKAQCGFTYCGIKPLNINPTYLDGYEEVITKYKAMYGDAIDV